MIKPVLHRIFVQPDKVDDADDLIRRARSAGLHVELDKREQKAVVTGTVMAVGSTCYIGFQTTAEEQDVKVGSKILYAKYSGADVPGTEYQVINDEDVLAVLGENDG